TDRRDSGEYCRCRDEKLELHSHSPGAPAARSLLEQLPLLVPSAVPSPTEPRGSIVLGATWLAEPRRTEPRSAEPRGAKPGSAEPRGAEPRGAEPGSAEPRGALRKVRQRRRQVPT